MVFFHCCSFNQVTIVHQMSVKRTDGRASEYDMVLEVRPNCRQVKLYRDIKGLENVLVTDAAEFEEVRGLDGTVRYFSLDVLSIRRRHIPSTEENLSGYVHGMDHPVIFKLNSRCHYRAVCLGKEATRICFRKHRKVGAGKSWYEISLVRVSHVTESSL